MKRILLLCSLGAGALGASAVGLAVVSCGPSAGPAAPAERAGTVPLPAPRRYGDVSVERAIAERRSVREFAAEPLSLESVAQLLWAAQGVTATAEGLRAAPSAGALYPLEVYLVAGDVTGLAAGIYRYEPGPDGHGHRLVAHAEGDARRAVGRAALGQDWVAQAPAILAVAGRVERTARKYGGRAPRYVHIEVGHAAQNVYLQAQALGLGTCMVGAFRDEALSRALALPEGVEPFALLPVGEVRSGDGPRPEPPRVPGGTSG